MDLVIKPTIAIQSLKFLLRWLLKAHNLLFRPKLDIILGNTSVIFTDQNNEEKHFDYFSLRITNKTRSDVYLNLGQIKINRETYPLLIQGDINFLKLNPSNTDHWKNCKNDILTLYQQNWFDILNNTFQPIKLQPHEFKIFPMKLLGIRGSNVLLCKSKNTLLFMDKNKIPISIGINGERYDFGVNRTKIYELYINYLASHKSVSIKAQRQ